MKSRPLVCFLLLLFTCLNATGQAKSISASGEYIHRSTNTKFPLRIDNYSRGSIISYVDSKENISVTYSSQGANGRTYFTVSIYPAGAGTEGRLRNEFLSSLNEITYVGKKGNRIQKFPIDFRKDGYKVNGLKAIIIDNNGRSDLLVYECGSWFFKVRITDPNRDSLEIARIENRITGLYYPSELVRKFPLKLKANLYFGKAAFADSLMLGSAMGSALKKIEWAFEKVDSLERISGFPDLYLELHKASLLAFVQFEKDHPSMSRSQITSDYLSQLNSIIDAGFLSEFIVQQFDNLLIIPSDQKIDLKSFKEWEINHPISINLNHKLAVIEYPQGKH